MPRRPGADPGQAAGLRFGHGLRLPEAPRAPENESEPQLAPSSAAHSNVAVEEMEVRDPPQGGPQKKLSKRCSFPAGVSLVRVKAEEKALQPI